MNRDTILLLKYLAVTLGGILGLSVPHLIQMFILGIHLLDISFYFFIISISFVFRVYINRIIFSFSFI